MWRMSLRASPGSATLSSVTGPIAPLRVRPVTRRRRPARRRRMFWSQKWKIACAATARRARRKTSVHSAICTMIKARSGSKTCNLMPKLDACGMTDAGLVRGNNEDNWVVDPALSVAIVADGMGGAACGEIASALTIAAVCAYLREPLEDLPTEQRIK